MNAWIYSLLWMCISGCLFARADSNPPFGTLQLPDGIAVYVTTPDGMEKLIEPSGSSVVLPAGAYQIHYWVCRRQDADGNIWNLKGYQSPVKDFEIGREPTILDIKFEPVKASITVRAGDGYVFRMKLTDPAGGTVYLYKGDNTSQPPPIVITNEDKSFSVLLTGKYG